MCRYIALLALLPAARGWSNVHVTVQASISYIAIACTVTCTSYACIAMHQSTMNYYIYFLPICLPNPSHYHSSIYYVNYTCPILITRVTLIALLAYNFMTLYSMVC